MNKKVIDNYTAAYDEAMYQEITGQQTRECEKAIRAGAIQETFTESDGGKQLFESIDDGLTGLAHGVLYGPIPSNNNEIAIWLLERRAMANALTAIKRASSNIIENGRQSRGILQQITEEMGKTRAGENQL